MEYKLGIDEQIDFKEDISLEDAILFQWNSKNELLKIRFANWDEFIVDLREAAKKKGAVLTSILYLPDQYKYKELREPMRNKLLKWKWSNNVDEIIDDFFRIY